MYHHQSPCEQRYETDNYSPTRSGVHVLSDSWLSMASQSLVYNAGSCLYTMTEARRKKVQMSQNLAKCKNFRHLQKVIIKALQINQTMSEGQLINKATNYKNKILNGHWPLLDVEVHIQVQITFIHWRKHDKFSSSLIPRGSIVFNVCIQYASLQSRQSQNPSAAFTVWLPVDSDTISGGKPHYSLASVGGGEFPFLTSFSACHLLFTVRLFMVWLFTVRRKNGVGVERPHLPADLFTSSQFTCC